jgi:hypothetical protein
MAQIEGISFTSDQIAVCVEDEERIQRHYFELLEPFLGKYSSQIDIVI